LTTLPEQVLGMQQELGPSGLVRRAIERGEGAGDDWDEYRHRLRQARSRSVPHAQQHAWLTTVLSSAVQATRKQLQWLS